MNDEFFVGWKSPILARQAQWRQAAERVTAMTRLRAEAEAAREKQIADLEAMRPKPLTADEQFRIALGQKVG